MVSRVPFATTFVTTGFLPVHRSLLFLLPLEKPPQRRAELGTTAQPGGSRGAAAESTLAGRGNEGKAHVSQWDEGAGPARLHEALHVRLRRGGAGRGGEGRGWLWPGPGPGWPVVWRTLPGVRGLVRGMPSQRSSHAPREVSRGQAGSKLRRSSGCQVAH